MKEMTVNILLFPLSSSIQMSDDDDFTLATMNLSEDESEHEIEVNQEEQLKEIKNKGRLIRAAKKNKQLQRKKWFRMILLFHRKALLKEYRRFEKHKENLVNQCIELTAKTFISKTIFTQTDFSIAKKGVPSILALQVLKHRPQLAMNKEKIIDRSVNRVMHSLDLKSPLLSLWPQALSTISPVINLGISLPPFPNNINDAEMCAPDAALNSLPTDPPYKEEQALLPLLDFVPVDYELRKEHRPYTLTSIVAEKLFQTDKKSKKRNKQKPLFFLPNGLDFLKEVVKDELNEIRNLEFVEHNDMFDNDSSLDSSDNEETSQSRNIPDSEEPESTYQETVEEEDLYEEEDEEEDVIDKEELLKLYVFDDRKLKRILEEKCGVFIDQVTDREVAKRVINRKLLKNEIITKPIQQFAESISENLAQNQEIVAKFQLKPDQNRASAGFPREGEIPQTKNEENKSHNSRQSTKSKTKSKQNSRKKRNKS